MNDDETEMHGWLIEERPLAIKIQPRNSEKQFWLPRSQISWMRKEPKRADGRIEITIHVADWILEKKENEA